MICRLQYPIKKCRSGLTERHYYLGGRFCANPDRSFESGLQTAFRFNSYIGLALAASLGAEAASSLMALLIGFMVPLCNLVAVYSLSHQRGNLLSELRKNPLILSTIAGLVCSMLALPIPTSVNLVLQRLGNASLALGLIAVGAGLRFTALPKAKALAATFLLIKLIFLPACGLLLARYLDLPLLQQQVLLLFCALPTASSAYILATRMDGNGPYVAFLISASTLLSVVTLPFWLGLSFSR